MQLYDVIFRSGKLTLRNHGKYICDGGRDGTFTKRTGEADLNHDTVTAIYCLQWSGI